tara:strand:- start:44 stop:277 length:234 start_codon:yes stop_codon:yes gene_type:complete
MITDLNQLIGEKVKFEVEPNKIVKCKIETAYLDEYDFLEKSDQMNVFVNLIPLDYDTNKDYDSEDFTEVSLTYVRKI